jgi:hypothetical protein
MNYHEPIERQTFPWNKRGLTIAAFLCTMERLDLV